MTFQNNYLFEALDAYPYDLVQTIESLNYALAYNENDPYALCLMGRVYAEQLEQFETAKSYFQKALEIDIYTLYIYPHYIKVLLQNEDYKEAAKLIEFALKIKGIDKGLMWQKKALLYECLKMYENALFCLKKARRFGYNSDFLAFLDREKERIQLHQKDFKPKKRKKVKNK
ncbi:tetratricopeptide repeat protein [Aureivirga marina]|uniref:tetratricopeptide repeat protein n=1 Tax=Aureivirga marina TaxID=1182451 RepID=UPI0018C9F8EA|nr:tetratricopeptide repeat protein [Aureivirga marina]